MIIETTTLPVGSLGVIDLTLPLIRMKGDQRGPRVVLVGVQHGGEQTPLIVFSRLVERLTKQPITRGTLEIIPVANPLGLLFGTRNEPVDQDNLNRCAPGSDKTVGSRMAKVITDVVRGADLVIDCHTFTSRATLFLGVRSPTTGDADTRACSAFKMIVPDAIWEISPSHAEDTVFKGVLTDVLAAEGTPAIGLEMERHQTISDAMIDRIADGLDRVIMQLGMRDGPIVGSVVTPLIRYRATSLYSDDAGLFIPCVVPGQVIDQGAKLGDVIDLRTLTTKSIINKKSGTVLTIRFRDVIRLGSKIASIGTTLGELN